MPSTVIDRRSFLSLAASAALGLARPALASPSAGLWLSANADAARHHALAAFDSAGECRFEMDLPARGHGIAVAPDQRSAVIVARRPGTFAAVVDLPAGTPARWIEAPPDRHFHGHGAFSADGRLFYTSENAIASGGGVIGVWAMDENHRRLGEFSSHGIEPHDLKLMPDGHTLVVANGGIRTHPDSGRARLNLDDMDSSLVHLDARDGRLLGQWRLAPELRLLSIRHLAVSPRGDVAIGLQYQSEDEVVPVVALQRGGGGMSLLDLPPELATGMRNYCGSVAMDVTGAVFAASCPRGNRVTLWDTASARLAAVVEVADGCGVAAGPEAGSLVMTSGAGGAFVWRPGGGTAKLSAPFLEARRWDNHATWACRPG